jgi:transposase InsO family protein
LSHASRLRVFASSTTALIDALQKYEAPELIHSDQGKEYHSRHMQDLLSNAILVVLKLVDRWGFRRYKFDHNLHVVRAVSRGTYLKRNREV